MKSLIRIAVACSLALAGTACASDEASPSDPSRPTVVVTTNILGDVVENLVGEDLEVVTIMPVGVDGHTFQASAAQVAQMGDADVLVVNGAGFEEGLLDVIEAAEADGVPVYEAISAVDAIDSGAGSQGHDDEEGHDDEGVDPHFFTDPARVASAAEGIVEFLADNSEGLDVESLRANAASYLAELESLDAEVAQTVERVPASERILVTNHEVFGYFADRYGFEVVGTVIPGGSTADGASAQDLAQLAETIEAEGVAAIFADTSSSDELAQTLAAEVEDIEVVELYSESLGAEGSDGATYVAMLRTNAQRIADALTS